MVKCLTFEENPENHGHFGQLLVKKGHPSGHPSTTPSSAKIGSTSSKLRLQLVLKYLLQV